MELWYFLDVSFLFPVPKFETGRVLRVLSNALRVSWDYRTFVKGENAEDDRQEAICLIDESIKIFQAVSYLNGSHSMYYCVTLFRTTVVERDKAYASYALLFINCSA